MYLQNIRIPGLVILFILFLPEVDDDEEDAGLVCLGNVGAGPYCCVLVLVAGFVALLDASTSAAGLLALLTVGAWSVLLCSAGWATVHIAI